MEVLTGEEGTEDEEEEEEEEEDEDEVWISPEKMSHLIVLVFCCRFYIL